MSAIGLDQPDRVRGRPLAGIVLDEAASLKHGVFVEDIRPGLATPGRPPGWSWQIGTPRGRNHFFGAFRNAQRSTDGDWAAFTWPSADIMDPDEVAAAKRDMDERSFDQELCASFLNAESRAYWAWDRERNLTTESAFPYNPKLPLLLCFDFGHKPGVMEIAQDFMTATPFVRDDGTPVLDGNGQQIVDRQDVTVFLDEIWIKTESTTRRICEEFLARYRGHQSSVIAYGDASGGARSSTTQVGGFTDWAFVDQIIGTHFDDFYTDVPKANGPQKIRLNAMCSRLRAADGTVRMMISTKCKELIDDMEGVELLDDGRISKKGQLRTGAA